MDLCYRDMFQYSCKIKLNAISRLWIRASSDWLQFEMAADAAAWANRSKPTVKLAIKTTFALACLSRCSLLYTKQSRILTGLLNLTFIIPNVKIVVIVSFECHNAYCLPLQ